MSTGVWLHVPPRVPAGKISEVRAWVGEDPRRARLALEAERKRQRRSTLLKELERLLA
jgi:hypothetical protein